MGADAKFFWMGEVEEVIADLVWGFGASEVDTAMSPIVIEQEATSALSTGGVEQAVFGRIRGSLGEGEDKGGYEAREKGFDGSGGSGGRGGTGS